VSVMGTSVADLVATLQDRGARLPFEIGAFVALEICEKLLEGPAVVKPEDVQIGEDGIITVYAPPHSAASAEAARSVAGVLAHLLVAAGSGVPPMLLELVEQGPPDGRWDLGGLRDELEASLVPLNRAAARRVLARLLRDAKRAPRPRKPSSRPPAKQPEPVSPPDDLDADLDALLGGEPEAPAPEAAPPPPKPPAARPPRSEETPLGTTSPRIEDLPLIHADEPPKDKPIGDALNDLLDDLAADAEAELDAEPRRTSPPPERNQTPPRERPKTPPPERPKTPPPERPKSPPPEPRRTSPRPEPRAELAIDTPAEPLPAVDAGDVSTGLKRGVPDLDGFDSDLAPKKKRGGLFAIAALLVIGLAIGAVAVFRPDIIDRILHGMPEEDPNADADAEAEAYEDAVRRRDADRSERYGTLTVTAEPERAQVLLFIGRGPAVAENLPVGVAHEVVTIADGRAPTRSVVPADSTWEPQGDHLLYELAMQAGDEEMAFADLDLGPTRLDRAAMGEPSGELGHIRVVTNPPNAKVFLLVGFAPEVTIRDLPTDSAQELLVYREGYRPERAFVGPSDWVAGGEGKTATLEVSLTPR